MKKNKDYYKLLMRQLTLDERSLIGSYYHCQNIPTILNLKRKLIKKGYKVVLMDGYYWVSK